MINTKTNILKKVFFLVTLLLGISSCRKTEQLTFEKRTVTVDDFADCKTADCVLTDIVLLQSPGDSKISKNINQEIQKTACAILNMEDDTSIHTVEQAIQQFNKSYQDIKKEFPEEIVPYEASIHCELSFQNENILSIHVNSYVFTGGAHGSSSTTYITLDTKTGKPITINSLCDRYDEFVNFAEKEFRSAYHIPKEESINSTGLFFENDEFILPKTIGFTDYDVILFYNQYEVGSYTEGPIELKIPKEKAATFFAVEIL